ncbi:NrfD/PsrC family molybdoenzyme membrane anchor subunit [Streptomyces sp. DSM 44915]|uniref:NrfD/PsrC family molybdoenzyme membrane anchor subunit n=1 Tax=Streptomyces chisholmiae TaxID=3075540 RepID=A0ABU2JSN2_9ACTN|nr:NrfD/PsrC family molybdoenzyme membrane anchor subunit [Streptomyces sp. DSM 44915]MDT0268005.1 NrfD/PsrC family molybdoenzyme membrane anchor subunit [Streptomyces sp. DSM 44915]
MSEAEVTRDGLAGVQPGREAIPGNLPDTAAFAGRRRGGGEQRMVPQAEFTSYYGRPVVKAPAWRASDIAGYLFLGGLAGAGSTLAAGAHLTGRPRTARALKLSSLGAISLSAAALIHDLGRPDRFLNMLRVAKPTSPMSVGSWLLAGYGPAAGLAAASAVTGRLPRLGTAATLAAAGIGPAVAAYTGVLLADTAIPAWHEGHRELPYLFTASAAGAASGMALLLAPRAETGPARAAAVLATGAELVALRSLVISAGHAGEPYRRGRPARLLTTAKRLALAGTAGAALAAGRSRAAAAASGAALLAASAATRFAVFHAGLTSARDPKYTVLPQRLRHRARTGTPPAEPAEPAE